MKTPEAYDAFFGPLFRNYSPKELDELIDWLRVGHKVLGYKNMMGHIPDNYLDIAFSMSLKLMSNWRSENEGTIQLIHDESSNMSRQKMIWEALVDPNLDPAMLGYDRRTISLPIAINETRFESSLNWVGLQIADVLAGATARYAQWHITGEDPKDDYGSNLSLINKWTFSGMIFPEAKVTPEELGTTGENFTDSLAHLAKVVANVTKKNS